MREEVNWKSRPIAASLNDERKVLLLIVERVPTTGTETGRWFHIGGA